MHRVWSIPEVVQEIVGYLDDGSLARVARTATFFQQPAHARLYAAVTSVVKLTSLVKNVTHASGDPLHDSRIRQRCLSRAKQVREVTLGLVPLLRLGRYRLEWSDVRTAFILLRRPLYVFPRLQSLIVATMNPHVIELAELLLCPTLELFTCRINGVHGQDEELYPVLEARLFSIIEGLPEKAPHLHRLEISWNDEYRVWFEEPAAQLASLLSTVCRRLPLQTFVAKLVPMTPQLLETLADIGSLVTITAGRWPEDLRPEDFVRGPYGIKPSRFVCLKTACLRGGSIISHAVLSMEGIGLENLDVVFTDWGAFMADLVDAVCCFAATLKELSIRQCYEVEISKASFQAYQMPGEVLARLSRCFLMESFLFRCRCDSGSIIDLRNPDLERLTRSWTRLKDIELLYGWDHNVIQLNSSAFIPFSVHCPELTSIHLHPLSPTVNDLEMPPGLVYPQSYRRLSIRYPDSFEDLPQAFACDIVNFLDTLWPNVFHDITDGYGEHEESVLEMDNVLRCLRSSRAMRSGSRWRQQHAGMTYGDFTFRMSAFDANSTGCPWEMIN